MKIGALHFGLDSSRSPFIAWHWSWSLTWSWGVWFRRGASGRLGFYHLPACGGQSRHCGLNTPLFSVAYQSQPTMPKCSARGLPTPKRYPPMPDVTPPGAGQ